MMTTSAHTAPWLLCRLLAALDGDTDLAGELLRAVGSQGVRDRERLVLTILGVMTYARRAGCQATEVRQAVDHFVRGTLASTVATPTLNEVARRCVAVVDAVYLLYGNDAETDPRDAARAVAPLLPHDPRYDVRTMSRALPRRW